MGLETDQRAGAVRVDPNSIVAKAGDLTPNIQALSKAFNEGFVNTQNIMDRFSSKNIAQDEAATAAAKLSTRQSTEIGPLAIEAQKAKLAPGVVAGEQEVRLGEIDAKLAEQDQLRRTRKQRDKIFEAQVGQSLDEITGHLPAATVAQLNNQFPQLGAKFDDQGRVVNGDEVRARMPDVLNYQKFLDASSDLTKQFEKVVVELPGGQKGLQTVWKGTNRPVPPAIVNAAIGAKEARFGSGFSQTGGVPQPGEFAGAETGTGEQPSTIQAERSAAPVEGMTFTPGTITDSGVLVTTQGTDPGGKPTEIQARGNKFYRRMSLAEDQFTTLLKTGFSPAAPKNVALRDGLAITSKMPVVGAAIASMGVYPPEIYQYDQVIKNFTSAILRDESGAAIRDDERAEYERMFFPTAGEPPETSAAKAAQRASGAAALKQVAEGSLSDDAYERLIEQITGRQFPISTSVRGVNAESNASFGEGPIVGNTTVKTPPNSSEIIRIKPGQPVPPDAQWVWFEGEASPRRRRPKNVPQAPASAPAPAPTITPRAPAPPVEALPLPVLQVPTANNINPTNRFERITPNSVSGIRG